MRAHSHPLLATNVGPCLPCLPPFPTRIKMRWAATRTRAHSHPSTLASAPRLPPPTSEHIGQLPHVPLVMHACPPRLHSSPLAFIMHASACTHPDSALCVYARSHARTRLRHPRIPLVLGKRFTRRYPRQNLTSTLALTILTFPPSCLPCVMLACPPAAHHYLRQNALGSHHARPPSCACSRSYTHPSTCTRMRVHMQTTSPCVYARSLACAWSRPHHPCVPLVLCTCATLPPSVIVRPPPCACSRPLRRVYRRLLARARSCPHHPRVPHVVQSRDGRSGESGEYMLGRLDLLVNK
ncbi:hypothetical protein L210DRAFT_2208795 [Boletus edulis BED1]|uniref:Uncharacterized protein n=1 Tax=Boletus edulis BED1 TaxID=1328754 RepID=A0AAD4BE06_BOLED|nr:hypothetical protein L210DRAFT_2208795 [Boletus edulis BED1]